MRTPFIAAGAGLGIDTTYLGNAIRLSADAAVDDYSRDFPNMKRRLLFLDHIELTGSIIAGLPTTIFAFLSYDAAGDVPATAEASVPMTTGVTTVALFGAIVPGGGYVPQNDGGSAGVWDRMFLQCRVDVGTVDISARFIGYLDGK